MQVGKAMVCVLELAFIKCLPCNCWIVGWKEKNRPKYHPTYWNYSKSFQLFEISYSIVGNSMRSPKNSLVFLQNLGSGEYSPDSIFSQLESMSSSIYHVQLLCKDARSFPGCHLLRQKSSQWGSQKLLQGLMSHELTAYLSVFNLFLT